MGEQPYVWTVGKVIEEAERLCERIALAQRTAEALGRRPRGLRLNAACDRSLDVDIYGMWPR